MAETSNLPHVPHSRYVNNKMADTNCNTARRVSSRPWYVVLFYKVALFLRVLSRGTFVFINNLYAIPAYLFTMLVLRPLLAYNSTLYWRIEGTLFHWLLAMVSSWSWMAGYTVAETGDDMSEVWEAESVVLVNHQSTADVPTLMYCLQDKGHLLDRISWIMDILFKYSNFGWVSMVHGDFFIRQGRDTRDLQTINLKKHLVNVYLPRKHQWIVLFPEGGFFRKRKVKSQEYARKNGYPVLEHVTLPRIGALKAILETLSPQGIKQSTSAPSQGVRPLKWVVDVTLGYPQYPMDLQTIIGGWREPVQTTVHYRKFPIAEVPLDPEHLTNWLYQRYAEKDVLLDEFYKTGFFPVSDTTAVPSHGDNLNYTDHTVLPSCVGSKNNMALRHVHNNSKKDITALSNGTASKHNGASLKKAPNGAAKKHTTKSSNPVCTDPRQPKLFEFDNLWLVFVHVFYICLTAIEWKVVSAAWAAAWGAVGWVV